MDPPRERTPTLDCGKVCVFVPVALFRHYHFAQGTNSPRATSPRLFPFRTYHDDVGGESHLPSPGSLAPLSISTDRLLAHLPQVFPARPPTSLGLPKDLLTPRVRCVGSFRKVLWRATFPLWTTVGLVTTQSRDGRKPSRILGAQLTKTRYISTPAFWGDRL